MPDQPSPRRIWSRRLIPIAVLGAVIAAALLIAGARDSLPSQLPLISRDADTVYSQLTRAGLPITNGEPKSEDFRSIVRRSGCASSRAFVRTDTEDTGWGFICVDAPQEAYRRISGAFKEIPLLVGPLYVEDGDGEVLVFGFGWPIDASKTVYDAIEADGTYLTRRD